MSEIFNKLRGMVRRVTVKNINDTGQMQTASAEVAEGIFRDDLEIMLPYGFVSMPDDDGAVGIAVAVGGDEGDMVLLPLSNPSQRMGGLSKGDVGLANRFGDRVIVGANGGITLQASASITLKVDGVSLTISAAGFAFDGGKVTHNGINIGSDHGHVSAPPGAPGPPVS